MAAEAGIDHHEPEVQYLLLLPAELDRQDGEGVEGDGPTGVPVVEDGKNRVLKSPPVARHHAVRERRLLESGGNDRLQVADELVQRFACHPPGGALHDANDHPLVRG